MAVFRTVLKLPLSEGKELHIVLEDKSPLVILSLHEDARTSVSQRTTIKLSRQQAIRAAMFLAGIGNLDNSAVRSASTELTGDDEDNHDPEQDPPSRRRQRKLSPTVYNTAAPIKTELSFPQSDSVPHPIDADETQTGPLGRARKTLNLRKQTPEPAVREIETLIEDKPDTPGDDDV